MTSTDKISVKFSQLFHSAITIKLSSKPITVTIAQVDEMIAELSRLFKLQPGDIIMTGTPAGIRQKFHH